MESGTRVGNDRVSHRVSLVLTLIDDFTNKVITGSGARVWIPHEKPPIRKAEGYHVFTNLTGPEVQVLIEAGLYESQSLRVRLAESRGYVSMKIRLTPNRAYRIPRDTTCVEGKAEPESLIRILCTQTAKPLKLVYDYRCGSCGGAGTGGEDAAGRLISLYHPETMDIEGKVLYIENSKSGAEFFRVERGTDKSGEYALEKPLSRDYKKIGSAVYLVHSVTANEKGEFFLPIAHVTGEKNRFLCEMEGSRTVRLERELRSGMINFLDFRKEER